MTYVLVFKYLKYNLCGNDSGDMGLKTALQA